MFCMLYRVRQSVLHNIDINVEKNILGHRKQGNGESYIWCDSEGYKLWYVHKHTCKGVILTTRASLMQTWTGALA